MIQLTDIVTYRVVPTCSAAPPTSTARSSSYGHQERRTLTAPRCGSREHDTSCRGGGRCREDRTGVGGLGEDEGVAGRRVDATA